MAIQTMKVKGPSHISQKKFAPFWSFPDRNSKVGLTDGSEIMQKA